MNHQCIHLRRPVVLQPQGDPYVPPGADINEIDERWNELCRANPSHFDGRLWQVLGVHRNGYGGAVVHVADCAYRFYAVQSKDYDLGVRPLGVKAMTICEDHVLMGKRSNNVAVYPEMWEFAPGGAVEPGLSPRDTILRELKEETPLRKTDVAAGPIQIGVIFDEIARTWEIVFTLIIAGEIEPRKRSMHESANKEYDYLLWRTLDDLQQPMTAIAKKNAAVAVNEWFVI